MRSLYREDKEYVLNVYNRINLDIVKGEGSYLYTSDGDKYLDMYSGIAVNLFGHKHEEVITRIIEQSQKYIHLSNYFASEPVVNLAKLLVENSFASKVFFANSGTEANEAAIKLARKFGKRFSEDKYQILSAHNSFHGRTCGALSLTCQSKYQDDFRPLLPGVDYFNFNDIADLESKVSDKTCAVFVEIIQGEGGIWEVSQEFIGALVQLSKKHNFLIIVDEIQTGMGRTGDLFAFEKFNFTPHIVTSAKALGGGIPLGAMLVAEELEDVLQPGDHGSTFGGNPLACSVGEFAVREIVSEEFCNEMKEKISYLFAEFNKFKTKYPDIIKEIRGRGFIIGIEVGKYANRIKEIAFEKKLLLNVTNTTVVRLLPALNIKMSELEEFTRLFDEILNDIRE
ncbi:MAG: aspartate aminotransferase family protein [Halanaerobiales bacterium]|nr:aspartate aminotransferase family protein [Halanaerobiales bacterium]